VTMHPLLIPYLAILRSQEIVKHKCTKTRTVTAKIALPNVWPAVEVAKTNVQRAMPKKTENFQRGATMLTLEHVNVNPIPTPSTIILTLVPISALMRYAYLVMDLALLAGKEIALHVLIVRLTLHLTQPNGTEYVKQKQASTGLP